MRILKLILALGLIVLIGGFLFTKDCFAAEIIIEDFEGFTSLGQNVTDLDGWSDPENSEDFLSTNDSRSFGSYALWGNWKSQSNLLTFSSPITEDGVLSYKFYRLTNETSPIYTLFYNNGATIWPGTSLYHYNFTSYEWSEVEIYFNFDENPTGVQLDYYINGVFQFGGHVSDLKFDGFYLYLGTKDCFIDNITLDVPGLDLGASLDITSPVSGSLQEGVFEVVGDYDLNGEEWDKIAIEFQSWDELSTCPIYGTPEWDTETDLGYFHFGSTTYWSDVLATSPGTFSIDVKNLPSADWNCAKCYFFNTTEQLFSEEKCQGYSLSVSGNDDPSIPTNEIDFDEWSDYYNSKSSQFTIPTELFQGIASALSPVMDRLGDGVIYVRNYFDSEQAISKGTELGQAIPKARGYLVEIDNFVNLPVSGFIYFYFLTLAVVISYKIISKIISVLKP